MLSSGGARDYCNPVVYTPAPDRLFHNNGDGTFTDVSAKAAITRATGRGLGVLAADFNEDGWIDVYVANDGDANQLWINERGTGVFRDEALLAGVAVSRTGQAQGSMGIDLADIDRDGDEDLFVTNLDNESNTFYLNTGKGLFEDRTSEFGLFRLGFTGFGTQVPRLRQRRLAGSHGRQWRGAGICRCRAHRRSLSLKQRNQLLRNESGRRFVDVTASAGPVFDRLEVARGLSVGDLDNDGDSDAVIFNNSGPARVLRNDVGNRQHWLGLRVLDRGRDTVQAMWSCAAHGCRRFAASRPMAATVLEATRGCCSDWALTRRRNRFACDGLMDGSKSSATSRPIATGSSKPARRLGCNDQNALVPGAVGHRRCAAAGPGCRSIAPVRPELLVELLPLVRRARAARREPVSRTANRVHACHDTDEGLGEGPRVGVRFARSPLSRA